VGFVFIEKKNGNWFIIFPRHENTQETIPRLLECESQTLFEPQETLRGPSFRPHPLDRFEKGRNGTSSENSVVPAILPGAPAVPHQAPYPLYLSAKVFPPNLPLGNTPSKPAKVLAHQSLPNNSNFSEISTISKSNGEIPTGDSTYMNVTFSEHHELASNANYQTYRRYSYPGCSLVEPLVIVDVYLAQTEDLDLNTEPPPDDDPHDVRKRVGWNPYSTFTLPVTDPSEHHSDPILEFLFSRDPEYGSDPSLSDCQENPNLDLAILHMDVERDIWGP